MLSAFGVDHGISKSFRKLAPKLAQAEARSLKRTPHGKNQTLPDRYRENYAQWRGKAGHLSNQVKEYKTNKTYVNAEGKKVPMHPRVLQNREKSLGRLLDQTKGHKEGAQAMVTGIGNQSKRKGRVLP